MRLLAHPPWLRAGLLALSCLLAVQAGTAAAQGVTDQAVKAGFVFNFIRFTQWPGVRPDDAHPLLLCAVGERPLDGQLVSLNGRRVDGRAVEVRMQVPPAEWPSCHMLFIGMGDRTESVLRGVGNLPVLTVGDQNGFVQAGGMIGLRVEDSRVRFDVNLAAAHRAGLTLNSQMLKLAGQVLEMNAIRRWLLDLPVARKLGLLLAVNTTLAVMAIALVFTVGGALTRYHDAHQQLHALAEVVGENSRAALAFDDRPGAMVILNALRTKQDISLAVLDDSGDKPFARREFVRENDRLQGPLSALLERVLPMQLKVTHRIDDGDVVLGRIELTAQLSDMWADVLESMGLMAFIGVVLAVLAVYFGMRLRSLVISPVLELARVSHWVSHSQDYSTRAARQGNDEVGRLVDDFNHMLSEIQARDQALRVERESLEERVEQRTAELKRAMDEATQANRVKSEFLSTVSHELRTPLTAISGSIGLLAGEALGPLPEQVLNLLKIAQKNGQRLALLINDLLDVEKLMAGKLRFDIQRQPLMPLLEQALADNQAYAQTMEVKLTLTDRIEDALVDVDALRLQQVLSNLLSNAAKFSPKGGRVELGAHRMGDVVRVSVTDHGVGIAPAFRHRVFEKFSQADSTDTRQKGGTGLGLAISREMIERMGGRIGFESEEGQGACFYFDLQLWYGNSGESVWSGLLSLPADAARILLLEKDPAVARMIQRMLARAGYAVDSMHNEAAALAQATRPHHCAAVLMELSSEDAEAITFVHHLRQHPVTKELPVVAITSEVERARLALGEDAPGVVLLGKPIDQSRLAALLDKVVIPQRPRSLRVLHVEDNGQDHRAVLDMSGGRFDMELATTLREARTRIELERFDVVVLDLTLPNESGWDLLPEIRSRQPDARVVVLTGGEISNEDAARVDAVLKKDRLSPDQLVRVIDARHERTETENP